VSARTSGEVWQHSKADGTSLLVLLAIADQAADDGVTHIQIESRSGKMSISSKARCSRATAFRAIEKLVEMGELQVVQVRRGTSTINVYRVVVGRIASVPVDYDRLPFKLPHPFAAPSQSETVPTVSSGAVQGLKSERSGSHPATSLLIKDLGPSTDPLEVQEEHTENGGNEDPDPRLLAMRMVSNDRGVRSWLRGVGHHYADSPRDFRSEALDALGARDAAVVEHYRLFAAAETSRQAYERWIDETADLPLDEIAAVVATWDDLDDVERQELLERAETLHAGVDAASTPRKAAA
jgi:hypothetical protein